MKDILAGLLNDGKLPFNPDDARIWKVWDEVTGPAISGNARPLWIKDGKLRVLVSNPVWLQELRFMETEIRERLNTRLGRAAVRKIDFRIGSG